MNKKELLGILQDKEKWEVYRKFVDIVDKSKINNNIYNYFDDISILLNSDKSYIKARAFILICALSKWDKDNKIENIIEQMLEVLNDDKPTIIRICLANVNELIDNKKNLKEKILVKLNEIDCTKYKDTMRPLIEKDIEKLLSMMK